MDIYIGGIIACLLGFFALNFVLMKRTWGDGYKWELGDYLIFGLCMLSCILWPIAIPYAIKKLSSNT